MPDPHTDLAPIIGPPPPPPLATADSSFPWAAGLAGLVLALALSWLALRLSAPRRELRRLRRAANNEDPRRVAERLARLVAHRHKLPSVSPMHAPAGISAAAWRAWVEALDAVRYGAQPVDRKLLARLCEDARDLLVRA